MMRTASYTILFLMSVLSGCIKARDYTAANVYNAELKSVAITITPDSIPADGSSSVKIDIHVLPGDTQDSINLSAFNFSVTTSLGTFAPGGLATVTQGPAFSLDSATMQRQYIAHLVLTSGTKTGTAALTIKWSGVEKDTVISFYKSNPTKMKMSVSSFYAAPNFTTEDTIFLQLSSATGTPSAGTPTTLTAYDQTYTRTLGLFRVANSKTNAAGQCSYIFVLGDSTINQVNYLGTINFVATAANFSDTLQVYSR